MIEITSKKTYIPEFGGNRQKPEPEQIRVEYRAATIAIKEQLSSAIHSVARYDKDGRYDGFETRMTGNDSQIMDALLISITGCRYRRDGREEAVTDSHTLMAAPIEFEPLKTEIVGVLRKEIYRQAANPKN